MWVVFPRLGATALCSSALLLATTAVASPLLSPRGISETTLSDLELYARFSSAAYCASENGVVDTIVKSGSPHGVVEAQEFSGNDTDTHGYIAVDETTSTVVVAFKGSSSIRNWITNFEFALVPCDLVDKCLVHAGFQAAWDEVSSVVSTGVAAALEAHPGFTVVITGHSLGGAVAMLAAAHLRRGGVSDAASTTTIDVYTYGAPRAGNAALATFATGQPGGANYRVTHVDDPVPRLPPALLGYRHTSPEYWLSSGNATTVAYDAADVVVCDGLLNLTCNSGTLGLDSDAHLYYFLHISDCAAEDGDAAVSATNDEELGELMDSLAKMDALYADAQG